MMYTNTSIMEENASTWIVSLFAKLFILAKHKGGEWSPLFICLVTFLLSPYQPNYLQTPHI